MRRKVISESVKEIQKIFCKNCKVKPKNVKEGEYAEYGTCKNCRLHYLVNTILKEINGD